MEKEIAGRKALQTIGLRQGDCMVVIPDLDAASVDAVVCDPPYG